MKTAEEQSPFEYREVQSCTENYSVNSSPCNLFRNSETCDVCELTMWSGTSVQIYMQIYLIQYIIIVCSIYYNSIIANIHANIYNIV